MQFLEFGSGFVSAQIIVLFVECDKLSGVQVACCLMQFTTDDDNNLWLTHLLMFFGTVNCVTL